MISLPEALATLAPGDAGWRGDIPANWLQGRTAYGGFSAALALEVARRSVPDLPALRTAQIAFIGPLAGAVTITPSVLRRGRTATFVSVDVASDAGLGLLATFVFIHDQPSRIDHRVDGTPGFPAPGEDVRTFRGVPSVAFTQNFEYVDQRDERVGPAEWLRWVRLTEREGLDPFVELLAIADCLPPAALRLAGGPAPLSSVTWLINLLEPPATQNGWYLLRAATDHARHGGSSQTMKIWNTAGAAVADQMQSVVLFV